MTPREDQRRILRFGVFEVDTALGELRRSGMRQKLAPQPFKVLEVLLEHPGELVTRDALQKKLWPDNTATDYDLALKKCVNRIRLVLADSAASPRFIETVPRRGYRFIATVAAVAPPDTQRPSEAPLPQAPEAAVRRPWAFVAVAFTILIVGGGALIWRQGRTEPQVTSIIQLTNDGYPKVANGACCTHLVNDGNQVYFSEMVSGRWVLAQVAVSGGDVRRVPVEMPGAGLIDFSIAGHQLLVRNSDAPGPMWTVTPAGGPPRQLGNVRAYDAAWGPGGRNVVYARDYGLYVADGNGMGERKITSLSGVPLRPAWSPDEKRLRFTVYTPATGRSTLWELATTQDQSHPLFPGDQSTRDECCGVWTADGKYFVYQSTRDHVTSVQAFRESDLSGAGAPRSVRLTDGPIDFLSPSPSPDGDRIFVVGLQKRGELIRYDRAARQFVPWFAGLSAEGLDFSADGSQIAWSSYPEAVVWRSRADGSGRAQLSPRGMTAYFPRWSPDGTRIAFTGSEAGKPAKTYVVAASGGVPEAVVPGAGPEFDPGWSSDGQKLVYADSVVSRTGGLHLLDLKGRHVSALVGSEGLFSPRWSPDGRFIAALTKDSMTLKAVDTSTGNWRDLVHGQGIAYPSWSRDSKVIYFRTPMGEKAGFYQVHVADAKAELVTDAPIPRGLAASVNGWWSGVDRDGAPLVLRDAGIQEVYALLVKWR